MQSEIAPGTPNAERIPPMFATEPSGALKRSVVHTSSVGTEPPLPPS